MSAHTFEDHRLRPATEADRELCQQWIDGDEDHRGRVQADFFLTQEPGTECFVLEDKFGDPVFFFKMRRALRLDIQFGPSSTTWERERTREALMRGFEWLREAAQGAGIREIIFESQTAPLIRLCEKRFGFETAPHDLRCGIAAPAPKPGQENQAQR